VSDDPLLAELEARARALRPRSPVLAFWQHPLARRLVDERIAGAARRTPLDVLAEVLDDAVGAAAVCGMSLRVTDPAFERSVLDRGLAATVVGAVPNGRVDEVRASLSERVKERLRLVGEDPVALDPGEPVSLVIARSVLHRYEDPEPVVRAVVGRMAPGGVLVVDEFVGPARHQWTDRQLAIINRLLRALPAELRVDLTAADGRTKDAVARPAPAAFAAANPFEAAGSERIVAALDRHLERVVFRPYGGAVFHQLFSRIMGNFARRPDLVGLVMELDAILTDFGVLDSDYLWAVYRRP
jgi:SAM-dependent methyltransferase